MDPFSQKLMVAVGVISGSLTGLIATRLALPFEALVMQANQHQGMSYHWTVLTFAGIGLIIGTTIGNVANFLLRRRDRLKSSIQ